jgi:two-component system, sensor histidine kinase and response regulator
MPDAAHEIRVDRRALSQIIINLTDNAIKFTEQGEVRLDLAYPTRTGRR